MTQELATQALVGRLRERQGAMTQAAFADYLGITAGFLSHLYRGRRRQIGLKALLRIGKRYPDLVSCFLDDAAEETLDDLHAE